MKFISWNVNGLRACLKKGFLDFYRQEAPDFCCLQETKMEQGQADVELNEGVLEFWNSAEKKGYSGTAVFTPHQPVAVAYGMDKDRHDHEGRLITLEYDATKLTLTEASGKALLNSFHEEAGCLTFGYANQEAIPAGSILATVTFTAEADTEAEFAVTTLENNEDYPGKEEHITVTVPEHDYIESVVPATCEAGGYTLYTCEDCGYSYRDNVVQATGRSTGLLEMW